MAEKLTDRAIRARFRDAGDFVARDLICGGQKIHAYMIDGLIAGVTASDMVFKPLSQMEPAPMAELYRRALSGTIYNNVADSCNDLAAVESKLVNGFCVILFPGVGAAAFEVKTPEKRGVSPPGVENTVKGPKDAFTETVRTNTSLLRRHLRTPDLRLYQTVVGTRSLTNVSVAWIEGITDPVLVKRLKERLKGIRVDGLLSPSSVEELVTGNRKTPFPLLQYTERADKFARGLLSGRVGLLVDGLPLGWLLPVDLGYLMTSPEDEEKDYVSASAVRILRYASLLTSLLLPGIYIALVTFHQQMIPLPLLKAMVTSRADVPFSSLTEVAVLLLAFELLQEAGLHLPQAVGHSVSIIGGIVVGSAAVEANLISPAALIDVSFAGICGFALPNRDLADSVRVCRFALTVLGGAAGLFGVTVGTIVLMIHLSGLTSLGHPYLAPFSQGDASGLLRRRINEMDRRGES